jgi:hypothetical protein
MKCADPDGYIWLYRKSRHSSVFQNSKLWHFWTWCLLSATHQPFEALVGFQNVHLNPGQFLFTRRLAMKELPLSEREIRTCVETLKKLENLTIKTTNKYSIITICNWPLYQIEFSENVQQMSNKRPANVQQTSHIQEHREYKKEIHMAKSDDLPVSEDDVVEPKYSTVFEDFWREYPRKIGKANAYRAWLRIGKEKRASIGQINTGLQAQLQGGAFDFSDSGKHIPHAATWLNNDRWKDETKISCPHSVTLPKLL